MRNRLAPYACSTLRRIARTVSYNAVAPVASHARCSISIVQYHVVKRSDVSTVCCVVSYGTYSTSPPRIEVQCCTASRPEGFTSTVPASAPYCTARAVQCSAIRYCTLLHALPWYTTLLRHGHELCCAMLHAMYNAA